MGFLFGQSARILPAVFILSGLAASAGAQVRTPAGSIDGVTEGDVAAYKGIPFAAPPIGDLRWRDPRPPRPWRGVLKADHYKPQCEQVAPPLPFQPREKVSEDCLYLNIWEAEEESRNGLSARGWIQIRIAFDTALLGRQACH